MGNVKERPILFSGEMVRAILDGHKSMTRRVINPQPRELSVLCGDGRWRSQNGTPGFSCPYGKQGDLLWVRETWYPAVRVSSIMITAAWTPSEIASATEAQYKADADAGAFELSKSLRWKPSIHMPRWASRVTLQVTGVRVEQVKDISREDAIAEGAPDQWFDGDTMRNFVPQGWYENLWDSLNAKRGYSWASNPWVWVISFRPCTAANQGLEPTAPKGKAKPVAKKPAAKKTAPKGKAKTLLAKSAKKK